MAAWPVALVAIAAIGALGLWIVAHRRLPQPRGALGTLVGLFARGSIGSLALWLVLQALGRRIYLATPWPALVPACLGGFAVEIAIASYAWERQTTTAAMGRALVALRVLMVLLMALVLAQPVWTDVLRKELERYVLVLVDDSESMRLVDRNVGHTRLEEARGALFDEMQKEGPSAADRLGDKYKLRYFRFSADMEEFDASAWPDAEKETTTNDVNAAAAGLSRRKRTDIAGALEQAALETPPESLAGILMLSDGRHNGPSSVDTVARKLGVQGSPVCSLVLGSPTPPCDASVLSLKAPEAIYLNDKVGVSADVKFDGMKGREVAVRLVHEDEIVDEMRVKVADDRFRKSIRFAHVPEGGGIARYAVAVEPIEQEVRGDNNIWDFNVAVSDDRTNVLLIDGYPRWEFRYLRNLFHGRDKSVHLQHVLLDSDAIENMPELSEVLASAARPFGESEATQLPENEEEWLRFDVIILGDVDPLELGGKVLATLRRCVAERGALLVLIAGPRNMPHAYQSPVLSELLPVVSKVRGRDAFFESPEPAYDLVLTPEGRAHPVMQQAVTFEETAELWAGVPALHWRHASLEAKPSATILAYAQPVGEAEVGARASGPGQRTLEQMADAVAEVRAKQQQSPLILLQRFGLGRVAMLTFDRTWRLRYRVGDTYHHRFWGQLLRWGTGERLRSGSELVRIGTDRVTYTRTEPVRVIARVLTEDRRPLANANVYANVMRDDNRLLRKPLFQRDGSPGIYETVLPALPVPGRYRIELDGDAIQKTLAQEGTNAVQTEVLVVTTRDPVELSELTADRDLLDKVATLSGGSVVDAINPEELLERFGPGNRAIEEIRNLSLWDSLPMLLLLVLTISVEWLLRRKAGLT